MPELADWLPAYDDDTVGRTSSCSAAARPGSRSPTCASQRGRDVTVLEPTDVFGVELGLPGRWRLVADLESAGARLVALTTVAAIAGDAVTAQIGGERETFPADTVIVAAPRVPDHVLADALRSAGITVHTVGDCEAVRSIEGANLDAAHVALAIG